MLQSIRDRATGVFAWVIVVLLIVPFALWGIQEYLGGGSAINVATINDIEISRNALNAQVDRDLRGKKDRPSPVQARAEALGLMVLSKILFGGFKPPHPHPFMGDKKEYWKQNPS